MTNIFARFQIYARFVADILKSFAHESSESLRILRALPPMMNGSIRARDWPESYTEESASCDLSENSLNPLRLYFESHKEGRIILKWIHYFEIYHKHLAKFVGKKANVLEIGVFGGGSLEMWKSYFGSECMVYGVDIRKECKAFEDEKTQIFIGNQGDRNFWKQFKEQVPYIDIVIDDGSHVPEEQIVTLEEMLPHISPGGVYLCEDIHLQQNRFAAYIYGLSNRLNAMACEPGQLTPVRASKFQRAIRAIHLYPFSTVIEKRDIPIENFTLTGRGTEWQPFP
jgi:hypothetical protein